MAESTENHADVKLWAKCRADATEKFGKWTAYAAMHANRLYRNRGGKYTGDKGPDAKGLEKSADKIDEAVLVEAHDLIFYENRSTPEVVSKGAKGDPNKDYGKQVSRRAATADEETKIAKGDWLSGYKNSNGKQLGPKRNVSEASEVRALGRQVLEELNFTERLHPRNRLGKFRKSLAHYEASNKIVGTEDKATPRVTNKQATAEWSKDNAQEEILRQLDTLTDAELSKLSASEKQTVMAATGYMRDHHRKAIAKRLKLSVSESALAGFAERLHPRTRTGQFAEKIGGTMARPSPKSRKGRSKGLEHPIRPIPQPLPSSPAAPDPKARVGHSNPNLAPGARITRKRRKTKLSSAPGAADPGIGNGKLSKPERHEIRRSVHALRPGEMADTGRSVQVRNHGTHYEVRSTTRRVRHHDTRAGAVNDAQERHVEVLQGKPEHPDYDAVEPGFDSESVSHTRAAKLRRHGGKKFDRTRQATRDFMGSEKEAKRQETFDRYTGGSYGDVGPGGFLFDQGLIAVTRASGKSFTHLPEVGGANKIFDKLPQIPTGHHVEHLVKGAEHGGKAAHHATEIAGKADPGIANALSSPGHHSSSVLDIINNVIGSSGSGVKREAARNIGRTLANVDPETLHHGIKMLTHLVSSRYDVARAEYVHALELGNAYRERARLEEARADYAVALALPTLVAVLAGDAPDGGQHEDADQRDETPVLGESREDGGGGGHTQRVAHIVRELVRLTTGVQEAHRRVPLAEAQFREGLHPRNRVGEFIPKSVLPSADGLKLETDDDIKRATAAIPAGGSHTTSDGVVISRDQPAVNRGDPNERFPDMCSVTDSANPEMTMGVASADVPSAVRHVRDHRLRKAGTPQSAFNARDRVRHSPAQSTLGLTPFRRSSDIPGGAGNLGTAEAARKMRSHPAYQARERAFEADARRIAKTHNVSVTKINRGLGVYDGDWEPSYSMRVRGGDSDVQAFNEEMGRRFGQEAVVGFRRDRAGADAEARIKGVKDPDGFFSELRSALGSDAGATFEPDGTVRVFIYGSDVKTANAVRDVAKRFGESATVVRGHGHYIETGGAN